MRRTAITRPESKEILRLLVTRYSPRNLVLFHRAILQNKVSFVKECLEQDDKTYIESTLLPIEVYEEIVMCEDVETINYEGFELFSRIKVQTEPYPYVPQIITGIILWSFP